MSANTNSAYGAYTSCTPASPLKKKEKMEKLFSDKNLTQFLSNRCIIICEDEDEVIRSPKKRIETLKYKKNKKLIVDDFNITTYIDDLLN
jgi:hypothetical protein